MNDAIYVLRGTEKLGPYSPDDLKNLLAQRQFTPADLAWREGLYDWQPVLTLLGAPPLPPGAPGAYLPPGQPSAETFGMRMLLPVGRSGWAIAAGYLGLFSMLLFPAPIALAISIVAIRDVWKARHLPVKKYGMGRAVFGFIFGLAGTIALVGILLHFR